MIKIVSITLSFFLIILSGLTHAQEDISVEPDGEGQEVSNSVAYCMELGCHPGDSKKIPVFRPPDDCDMASSTCVGDDCPDDSGSGEATSSDQTGRAQ